jgi:hypothetical protein
MCFGFGNEADYLACPGEQPVAGTPCPWPPGAEGAAIVDLTCQSLAASQAVYCPYSKGILPGTDGPASLQRPVDAYASCVHSVWQILSIPCQAGDAAVDANADGEGVPEARSSVDAVGEADIATDASIE